jgi:hypothetical protein
MAFRDCRDCGYEPGDCLFCSDVVKNMFKPKKEAAEIRRPELLDRENNQREETNEE